MAIIQRSFYKYENNPCIINTEEKNNEIILSNSSSSQINYGTTYTIIKFNSNLSELLISENEKGYQHIRDNGNSEELFKKASTYNEIIKFIYT